MSDLAAAFAEHRGHLRAVASRMLGSTSEADDALQEAWLKAARADVSSIESWRSWLTTIVARVCLDMLRSRSARHEEPLAAAPLIAAGGGPSVDRELEDAVGLALLVMLDKLEAVERIAFVLHDMFGMPFDEIAPVIGRSTAAARQIASRARRRVQGGSRPETDLQTQRALVEAFIAALRAGDVEALVAVLTPGDASRTWAKNAIAYRRATEHMRAVLVDGNVGLALAPRGTVQRVLIFTFEGASIRDAEVVMDADALAEVTLDELA